MENRNRLQQYKKFYLIGIGGAGMSAIAIVLNGMGYHVSGSDIKESRYTNLLKNEGLLVNIGHDRKNVEGWDAVIFSTAISKDNPELIAAGENKIPIFSRGDILAWILNSKKGIAVTGTHGKTTTTSMISLMLRGLELDPTIIIGGELNELGSNARFGNSDYIIAEACESDGTFLKYQSFIGVVTNIEEDHMDYWKDFELLKNSFLKFINNIKKGGLAVINGDEIRLADVLEHTKEKVITFGTGIKNDLRAENIKLSNFASSYDLVFKSSGSLNKLAVKLNVPGHHNIKNSLAALSVCFGLGLDTKKAISILQYFTGVKRRFEKRGEKSGAAIFDDYAHHPTEVKATLEAAALEKKERIITVFQPHRYTRLAILHDKFSQSFTYTDILVITDVFGSDEQPIPGVTGKLLVDSLIEEGFNKKIAYIPKLPDVKDYLDANIRKGDIVLLMGAGDITRVTDDLLKN
ncbi:MAG: UDP-N-acetylmuramate--L-alanine ligase [Actinobacteria bacterium]|nr:UDP-N-acetylmuramate--L-alanine ligase [Actinomycetota bacterium]